MIELELPYPPSVNHYWRRVGARMLISRGGRAFRAAVCAILAARGVRPIAGPLELVIDVFPPDQRRRDLDNLQKALLDALAHGGAYHDDSQIARLTVQRQHVVPEGKVQVRLAALAATAEQSCLAATAKQSCQAPVVERDRWRTSERKAKQRTCLKCGKLFDSAGPGNRICKRCTQINARIPITEEQLKKQRGVKRHNGWILEEPPRDESD